MHGWTGATLVRVGACSPQWPVSDQGELPVANLTDWGSGDSLAVDRTDREVAAVLPEV